MCIVLLFFGSFVICERAPNESFSGVHDRTNEERDRILRIGIPMHRLTSGGRIQVPVGDLFEEPVSGS